MSGSNNDGIWNENGKSIQINITPPWWKSGWFYFILICFLIASVGFIVSYLIKLNSEIRERIQAEDKLKFSAERFERWKSSSPIGIIQSNAKGGINDVNETVLTMLGYSRQDLLEGNIDWIKLTPPEFLHLDQKAMEEAADKGFWTPSGLLTSGKKW